MAPRSTTPPIIIKFLRFFFPIFSIAALTPTYRAYY
jgi:hypothetical protein